MSSTTFTNGTPITSPWLNSVNQAVYDLLLPSGYHLATLEALAATGGSALVGYLPAWVGAFQNDLASKTAERVSLFDFMTPAQRINVSSGLGTHDVTAALIAAMSALNGIGTVECPRGRYSVRSAEVPSSSICLSGDEGGGTVFASPSGRWGHTIVANDKEFVAIRNITFDNNLASVEGGLWMGGARNCLVDNCKFLNGDSTSLVISGVGGAGGGTRIAYDNVVRNCYAKGQKTYHPDGTSPFIAGNNAQRTVFFNCFAEDCNADPFDADNAPGTRFVLCTAKKSGARSTFSAFWSECTETNPDGYQVTWESCTAVNFNVGFATSEKVQGAILNPTAINCGKAIWHHSTDKTLTVLGGTVQKCGENLPTSGAVLLEQAAVVSGLTFVDTQYTNCIQVYSGGSLTNVSVQIDKCQVDKDISLGYLGGGPDRIRVSGCTLYPGADITWSDCANKTASLDGNTFHSGGLVGARIGRCIGTNNTFIDGNAVPTLTAVNLTLDTFNTYLDNNTFINFLTVNANNNATMGRNTYLNCTNSPDERSYVTKSRVVCTVGGTAYDVAKIGQTRGSYLLLVQGELNDQAVGAYLVQAASNSTGHVVTMLAQQPDFGTSNYFTVTSPSNGTIKISHPTAGRVAQCTLTGYFQ